MYKGILYLTQNKNPQTILIADKYTDLHFSPTPPSRTSISRPGRNGPLKKSLQRMSKNPFPLN